MTLKHILLSVSVLLSAVMFLVNCSQEPASTNTAESGSSCSETTEMIDPFSGESQLFCVAW